MKYNLVRISKDNYSLFDDMVYWRINGVERIPSQERPTEEIIAELSNHNLFVYVVEVKGRYVGWISLVYIPKIGKYNGKGHIYIDELWVHEDFRGKGIACELMKIADELKKEINATGCRLYVNTENEHAKRLYEKCDFETLGTAYFMEK